jgi:hypothetical protein
MFAARKMMMGSIRKPELLWSRSGQSTGNDTSLVIGNDSGAVAGDLLVMIVGCSQERTVSPPDASWNEVFDNGVKPSFAIYWKYATGSEPGTYTFTFSTTGANRVLSFLRFKNARFETVGSVNSALSGGDVVIGGITVAGGILFAVARCENSAPTYAIAGMTSVTRNGAGGAIEVFQQAVASGPTGTRTLDPTGTALNAGILFSIKGK